MNRNQLNFALDLVTAVAFLALTFTGTLLFLVLPSGSGGRGGGLGLSLWGWNRHDYGNFHFVLACVMVGLILIHVWLHWRWLCSTLACLIGSQRPESRRRRLYGLGASAAVAVFMAGGLTLASAQVETTRGTRPALARDHVLPDVPEAPTSVADRPSKIPKKTPTRLAEDRLASTVRAGPRPATQPNAHESHVRGGHAITGQTTLVEAAQNGGMSAERLREKLGLPANVDVNERLGRLKRWYGVDILRVRKIVGGE